MAFDPSEPRDPHGKWLKLAQGIKRLSAEDHTTVVKAIGELPKGGKGNRTSIKGVEVRRHQNGGVQVKIGGMARQYGSHEQAAHAIIGKKHVGEHAGTPASDTHIPKPAGTPGPKGVKPKASSGKLPGQSERDWQNSILSKGKSSSSSSGFTSEQLNQMAAEMMKKETAKVEAQDKASGHAGGATIINPIAGGVNAVNLHSIINSPSVTLQQLRQAESSVSSDMSYTASGRALLLKTIRGKIKQLGG